MPDIKGLIGLSFAAAIGITLLILACSADSTYNWWPLFVLIFYFLTPIPTFISRKYVEDTSVSILRETMLFVTTGFVISAFALPAVLAIVNVIKWEQVAFTWSGNAVVFASILFYFIVYSIEDDWFSM